jgi:2,4-dienoyl-CoA reductase-like NADH-dependent reductase (Old Yellow Enzyme family)
MPRALDRDGIYRIQQAFRNAGERAAAIGFDAVELHAAHGYLFHQFLSPLSNRRTDAYGGSFENRTRFLMETVALVRDVWPASKPLLVRLSATDWLEFDGQAHPEGVGWSVAETIRLGTLLREAGVDLLDISSGGNEAKATIPVGPGYQTGFAAHVRSECSIPTAAVGLITTPEQADHVIRSGQADLVFLAREMLRNPYWPLEAARVLNRETSWPVQYVRAAGGRKPVRRPFERNIL